MRCNLDGSKHGSVSRIDILSLALSFPTYRLDLASNRRLHASRCAIAQDLLIASIRKPLRFLSPSNRDSSYQSTWGAIVSHLPTFTLS